MSKFMLASQSLNWVGSAATPSMRLYIEAAMIRNRMAAVICPVSTSTRQSPRQVSRRLSTPMASAPAEPAAPASSGENQPV